MVMSEEPDNGSDRTAIEVGEGGTLNGLSMEDCEVSGFDTVILSNGEANDIEFENTDIIADLSKDERDEALLRLIEVLHAMSDEHQADKSRIKQHLGWLEDRVPTLYQVLSAASIVSRLS